MRPASADGLEPPDEHPLEELVCMIDGRLGLDDLRRVVKHTRACAQCQAELVEIAAGSGALRLAGREELVPPSELPAASFLDQVEDEAKVEVHSETAAPGPRSARRGARAKGLTALVAAAAAVIVAATVTFAVDHRSHGPATEVAFTAVDRSGARGLVRMQPAGPDKAMTVTTALAPPADGTYYEVWLLQRHTGAMVPVGVLPRTGDGRYVIPAVLVTHYDAVDISLQQDNGSTVHSADSVLRAYYSS